ncbi:DUF6317 family protein [Mycobacteroides franklinii]|uniref:DUF6317 family protein n=1 Tax=Mycobacteroides franklinii TaxID=948102 RepID=UPI0012FF7E30|nr:DUF6317 family protein [Mycobacteroides franklinii]
MAWLQVVLDELNDMSHKFQSGSREYQSASDQLKISAPDSGDGRLNNLISQTLNVIDVLNRQVSGEIEEHGQLIDYAKGAYERHETDNRMLFDDMMKEKQ